MSIPLSAIRGVYRGLILRPSLLTARDEKIQLRPISFCSSHFRILNRSRTDSLYMQAGPVKTNTAEVYIVWGIMMQSKATSKIAEAFPHDLLNRTQKYLPLSSLLDFSAETLILLVERFSGFSNRHIP